MTKTTAPLSPVQNVAIRFSTTATTTGGRFVLPAAYLEMSERLSMNSIVQPPHCLVMGPAGSGKTTSIATLAQAGLEVFVMITEPTGVDSLLDAWDRLRLPISRLHYHVVAPASPGWQGLKDMSVRINAMSYKDLSELKSGIGKDGMKQLPKFINNLETFYDERSGQSYGDVTTWGPDRALCIDSLSGISLISLQHTVGFKPSPHQGEWGHRDVRSRDAVTQIIVRPSVLLCFNRPY